MARALIARIAATGSLAVLAAAWPAICRPRSHVPGGQGPLLVAAELGDLAQGVGVFVGLDPDAGEGGGDVFAQPVGESHNVPFFRDDRSPG